MSPRPRKRARTTSLCSPPSSWRDLPLDVAGEVLRRLPSYADRICFGAACRSWRASAREHHTLPLLPCLCFTDGSFRGFPEDARPFRLPAAAGYHSSCGEWLVFELADDGAYTLVNPFSKAVMAAPLPGMSHVRVVDEPIRVADERVLPEEYDLRRREQRDEPRTLSIHKMVVCSPRLVAAVVGEGQLGAFAVCRPGAPWWSMSSSDQWRRLKDMVFYQGKLYAVDHNEDLLAVTVDGDEHGEPAVSQIDRVIEGAPPDFDMYRHVTLHYLVESGGALLMVRREICRAAPPRPGMVRTNGLGAMDERFTVFEADFGSSRWAEVHSVGGDRALFLGRWCSRAVAVADEEWADRIFFLEDGAGDNDEWYVRWVRYSLSVTDVRKYRRTESLPPLISRDGVDLPATWLFPTS